MNKIFSFFFENEEQYKWFMSVVMVSAALLAAVITALQTHAGGLSAQETRNAQQYAIQAMGTKTVGQAQLGSAQYTAQAWYELARKAASASEVIPPDQPAISSYREAQNRLLQLNALLSKPYSMNVLKYEADTYVRQMTLLDEAYQNASNVGNAWNRKAREYVTQIALLAVALFLFGLATVFSSNIRGIFLLTGSFITTIVVIWAALVIIRPVNSISYQAMTSLADGAALSHQRNYTDAITRFDQALKTNPRYANACYQRAYAYTQIGKYNEAIRDYKSAIVYGKTETSVYWNLGWVYYLSGNFSEAIKIDQQALKMDPDLLPVQFNLALATLAAGQESQARNLYNQAMDAAARQVARAGQNEMPYSFWTYLEIAAIDLEDLKRTANNQSNLWSQAPATASLHITRQSTPLMEELITHMRTLTLSLERSRKPPERQTGSKVTAINFMTPMGRGGGGDDPSFPRTPFEAGASLDSPQKVFYPHGGKSYDSFSLEGNIAEIAKEFRKEFSFGSDIITAVIDYQNIQKGQVVTWKVLVDGREDYSLRHDEVWKLPTSGIGEKGLTFLFAGTGEYTVEMYVDNQLVNRSSFIITEPKQR